MPKAIRVACPHCTNYPHKHNLKQPDGTIKNNIIWETCEIHKWKDDIPYSFYDFTKSNTGYCFVEKSTGKIFKKIDLYIKFMNSEEDLILIMENKHDNYVRVDSKGWNNGELIEPLDTIYKKNNYGKLKDSL